MEIIGRPSGWSLYPVLRDFGSSVGGRAGSVFALMSRLEFDDRKVDATPGAANGDQHPAPTPAEQQRLELIRQIREHGMLAQRKQEAVYARSVLILIAISN